MDNKPSHPEKGLAQIVLTLAGILIEVSPVQFWNILSIDNQLLTR
jgi:hypothetical protein